MYASKRAGKDRVTGVSIRIRGDGRGRTRTRRAAGPIGDSGVASSRERRRPRARSRDRAASRRAPSAPHRGRRWSTSADERADLPDRHVRRGRRRRARPGRRRSAGRLRLQPDLQPDDHGAGDAYAELAGGEAGLALASGMGAIHAALASLLRAGDRIVAPVALYGSTRAQLLRTFAGFGVRVDFVDTTDLDAVADGPRRGADPRPLRRDDRQPDDLLADHAALAGLAHRHGATYVVDNTFASPYVCRPLELGADLVVESATKFLGGHSDVIAGVVAGSARADRRGRAGSRSIRARRSGRSRPSWSCAEC